MFEDADGYIIEISGKGKMKDFDHGSSENLPPWSGYMEEVVSVIIKPGITHVGDIAFQECGYVQQISLPNGLVSIGNEAFTGHYCEEIVIPASMKTIGKNAFVGGQTDYTFIIKGNETTFDANEPPFDTESDKNVNVIAYEDSWTAKNWSIESECVFLDTIPSYEYNDDKTKIIKYLSEAANVTIPESVTTIGAGAFAGHTELISVNLGNVTSVEEGAFSGCDNLATIYGKSGSIGESLARELDCEFVALKPYLKDKDNHSIEKQLPVGKEDTLKLSELFVADYATELKFQVKEGSSDYQDVDGGAFSFVGDESGTKTYVFRAVDSDGVSSDDVLTVSYNVVENGAPVRADDKSGTEIITTLGKQVEVDLSGIFTDPDDDQLVYKVLDVTGIDEGAVDWNEASELQVNDGKFTTERMWTLFVSDLGKEKKYLVKAFDKWNVPSDDAYLITLTMYGTKVHISKGNGVHELEGLSISFNRDGADPVTAPVKVVDNDYYFNLEYQTRTPYGPNMEVFADGYTYAYTVKLEGCEDVTGSYATAFNSETNIINVELTNPEQAAKDEQSIAVVKDLIDKLGEVTLDSETAIDAAQEEYDDLYEDLKPQVTNYNKLLQARLALAELKLAKAEADKAAAEADKKAAEDAAKQAEADKKTAEDNLKTAQDDLKKANEAKGQAEADKKIAEDNLRTAQDDLKTAQDDLKKANEAKDRAEADKKTAEEVATKAVADKKAAEEAKAQAEKKSADSSSEKAAIEDALKIASDAQKVAEDALSDVKAELAAMKLTVKGLKAKAKKRKFTVKWKKNVEADGYRVQYKLSGAKKFKTLKTLTKTKAVTKKLKKGKKYEFRVAAYKKINGKKVFGMWTEAKIVKCK